MLFFNCAEQRALIITLRGHFSIPPPPHSLATPWANLSPFLRRNSDPESYSSPSPSSLCHAMSTGLVLYRTLGSTFLCYKATPGLGDLLTFTSSTLLSKMSPHWKKSRWQNTGLNLASNVCFSMTTCACACVTKVISLDPKELESTWVRRDQRPC